jgi:putative FmdB family regulatory protein
MPTYDYKCSACGHQFEELQSFSEPPLVKCPKCKKKKLARLFGGGGAILFKGSGFYETDYRRAGAANGDGKAEAAETKEPAASAAKTEAKSEAKSETKSESKSDARPASGGGGKKEK